MCFCSFCITTFINLIIYGSLAGITGLAFFKVKYAFYKSKRDMAKNNCKIPKDGAKCTKRKNK